MVFYSLTKDCISKPWLVLSIQSSNIYHKITKKIKVEYCISNFLSKYWNILQHSTEFVEYFWSKNIFIFDIKVYRSCGKLMKLVQSGPTCAFSIQDDKSSWRILSCTDIQDTFMYWYPGYFYVLIFRILLCTDIKDTFMY